MYKELTTDVIRIGTKAAPSLVLSSYSDREAGRLALRSIRRSGFRRAAAISSLPSGRIFVEDNGFPSHWGALAAGLTALAVAVGYFLLLAPPPRLGATEWTVIVTLTMLGTLVGWLIRRWLDRGVRDSILDRY
ncbi:MAG: hypothetical protein M1358_10905, partial [Chloroflexi bacterium]|nr:hypothetical protein [Chloroflexota bacterium]